METLWSPWRMEYLNADKGKDEAGCIFCAYAAAPATQDREHLLLWRGERTFIIMNLYPYNNGHLMIVPYQHAADLTTLDEETAGELMTTLQGCISLLKAVMNPQGYNIGMNLGTVAGAGIADHVHMHLVPRWGGDTNFMPVVGNTRVLPELLSTTYDKLRAYIDEHWRYSPEG